MHWYLEALKKYATMGGRARRKEYWYFALFNMIIVCALAFFEVATEGSGVMYGAYSLGALVPSFTVGVRRLHDTGHSAWFLFIGLIPIVGALILLYNFLKDSDPGENDYGSNPKEVTA